MIVSPDHEPSVEGNIAARGRSSSGDPETVPTTCFMSSEVL